MNQGFISINRKIREHWIWQDPVKLRWWLDILMTVNHKPASVNLGMKVYECERGQSVRSYLSWGNRWCVSKDTARNFLKLLEKHGMVTIEKLGCKSTRITVCNYNIYQQPLRESLPLSITDLSPASTRSSTNNNDNNKNKKRRTSKFGPPTWEEFDDYFRTNGFPSDLARRAFLGYEEADWHDSKGNPIKNWRQKCQHVWFKPESQQSKISPNEPTLPAI